MSYTYKVGHSWFLPFCKVTWVLRVLSTILAFRSYVVSAHLLGLCYGYVFAFDCFWLNWDTVLGDLLISPLCVFTLGMP